jgi:hypothetical protein
MGGIGAAFDRLITTQPIPPCQRCGKPMDVVKEERVAMVPPIFDATCRCSGCGALMRVRQVLPHFE